MKQSAMLILFYTFLSADSNVSGKVFFNHTMDLDEGGIHAFNMKRAYLTYTNEVSDDVSYKVTYDMGSNDAGSDHTAFLKVAMVNLKTDLGNVTIGMQGMNMFKTMENTWGHRFIAKMPMDTYGYSASTDLGVGLSQSFGSISTSALITNGGGYKKTESDKHKKVSLHTVYGESQLNKKDGFNAGMSLSYEPYDMDSVTTSNTNVMGLFAGYAVNGFRGGFEYDSRTKGELSEHINSAYGTYKFNNKFSILGRFDKYESEIATIIGIHYSTEKTLTIAPTLRITKPEGGDAENAIVVNFRFSF